MEAQQGCRHAREPLKKDKRRRGGPWAKDRRPSSTNQRIDTSLFGILPFAFSDSECSSERTWADNIKACPLTVWRGNMEADFVKAQKFPSRNNIAYFAASQDVRVLRNPDSRF
ncbi:hypothetical protein CHS0354_007441 [Potamilus streckersoni]|uniref:Uncharacterized protein n=1 Tax=Potamilus streckersoni TaxID=2493646 RepID=A0AAE0SW34_9BIVA|nr:hypothetical protein CHS0354_007441 [Potamilus streckersoni]